MQEIIFQQRNAAKPLTGRAFVLNIAGMLVQLAIAQIIVNALITLTGVGLFNVAFYLFAVWLLIAFMRETVAGYVYTLKEGVLVLERKLGDSTITVVEIPLDKAASLREVRMGENLHISYRDVMHIDAASRPPLRVRAAFAASLLSSHLARILAGKRVEDVIGHVIVFDEGSLRRACTFCPNEEMLGKLEAMLGQRYGFDERMTRAKKNTLYARALERAFPTLYAYVDPLVKQEDVDWAREEIARQKAERQGKRYPDNPDEAGNAGEENTKEEAEADAKADAGEENADAQQETPRRRRKQV